MAAMIAVLAHALVVCTSAALASTAAQETRAGVTPLQQVLNLLDGMVAKGKQEKHEEEVEFAKFHEWCDQTRAVTTKSIEQAKAQIEQLKADIAKAEADAEGLAADIAQLEALIAQAQAELKAATELRQQEHADYTATHLDLSQSVDALERAIAVLKSREADVPQSLLQVQNSPHIPHEAKAVIESFLAMSSGDLGVPEANAYEFQSGSVAALLEKLRLKFQDQRLGLQKEEMNNKHNFEMLAQKLTDNIKEDGKNAARKTSTKAQRLASAAAAKGDLKSTEDEKNAARK